MKAIVFDLDGTLIDSAPDIHAACVRMLSDEGHAPLSLDTIISFIGNGAPKLVERVMRAKGIAADQHERLTSLFLRHHDASPADLTTLYPGLEPVLHRLKSDGYALGICSNTPEAPCRAILGMLNLDGYFQCAIGGDSLPRRKPDPAPLHKAFADLGATEMLYVGDSDVDAETAARAGIRFALFTEGYRKRPVKDLPHTYAFSDYPDLIGIVEAAFTKAA